MCVCPSSADRNAYSSMSTLLTPNMKSEAVSFALASATEVLISQ